MNRPLKFRYAGELAGGLVLVSVALAIAGVVMAGRTQGWFERRFTLNTRFDTPKGSYGLREGNEIIIMNAVAGRVGQIVPTEEGHLTASFILKERFRQFVFEGSVARVKKKFGVAGDSFVEIEVAAGGAGRGRVVSDGDYIQCLKDEEVMETAQKALKNVQRVGLPMLEQIEQILQHANAILALLEAGEGTAGALLNDPRLADELKGAVSDARTLLVETRGTFRETTRLVKAAQKHWLFRKHVEKPPDDLWLTPATYRSSESGTEVEKHEPLLRRARAADDANEVARSACNLAVCLLSADRPDAAIPYVEEARAELTAVDADTALTYVLEAEIMRALKRRSAAFAAARRAVDLCKESRDTECRLEAGLLLAGLYCDAGDSAGAGKVLDELRRPIRKTESRRLKAVAFSVRGRKRLLDGDPEGAGKCFDEAAAQLRDDASYVRMADALADAGDAHALAKSESAAADRYFRSARTLIALGYRKRGSGLLSKSERIAKSLEDKGLLERIHPLSLQLSSDGAAREKKN